MKRVIITLILGLIWAFAFLCSSYFIHKTYADSPVGKLRESVSEKINDLLMTDFWSHIDSDGSHTRLEEMRVESGVDTAGENLYRGPTCDIRYIVQLWDNSPSHKEVLDTNYDYAIIEISRGENYCYSVMNILDMHDKN